MTGKSTVEKPENLQGSPTSSWQTSVLPWLALVLALVAVINAAIWFASDQANRVTMRTELFKSLLTLALVAIIGGGVAALYKAIERNIETSQLRAKARSDYLARLGGAYRDVKRARRVLRAAGIVGVGANPVLELTSDQLSIYDTQMLAINQSQLDLEALKIEARTLPDVITIEGLDGHLSTMEKYLGKIVTEWEEKRPQPTLRGSDLTVLSSFARKRDSDDSKENSQFQSLFTDPHNQATMLVASAFQPHRRFLPG